ncbi:DUF4085 family protein [Methylocaldum gracile]|uniref:DUF4085 family protein n=1 Tax=unclassified Methylocaldum TaxID=2622260 RepID=UPI00105E8E71
MKYFTTEWWENGCEEAQPLFEKYEAYISSIQSALPPALMSLHSTYTLHDSEVKRIQSDFPGRKLSMELSGWNRALTYPVSYRLEFRGVTEFEQQFPMQEYVEQELGDLGYWEIEKVSGGIEVRMLFVSTTEFRIVFQDFEFTHERVHA